MCIEKFRAACAIGTVRLQAMGLLCVLTLLLGGCGEAKQAVVTAGPEVAANTEALSVDQQVSQRAIAAAVAAKERTAEEDRKSVV